MLLGNSLVLVTGAAPLHRAIKNQGHYDLQVFVLGGLTLSLNLSLRHGLKIEPFKLLANSIASGNEKMNIPGHLLGQLDKALVR